MPLKTVFQLAVIAATAAGFRGMPSTVTWLRPSGRLRLSPVPRSTVTARIESAKRMAPLLVEQLTAPVRFTHAGQALIREGVQTFVEVGPGNVLAGLIKRIDRSVKTISVSTPEEVDKLEETLLSA